MVAAAQVGQHEDGRRTYGHSLVVDPWGEVALDMGGEGPGLAFAEIDHALNVKAIDLRHRNLQRPGIAGGPFDFDPRLIARLTHA